MLSAAELGGKLYEKSIVVDSVLKMKICVRLLGFDQAFICCSRLCNSTYCRCVSEIASDTM